MNFYVHTEKYIFKLNKCHSFQIFHKFKYIRKSIINSLIKHQIYSIYILNPRI